jgi:hypothetical protein
VLKQSSRRTPCPVCGRNTDGDCRFSDELILCHCGSRFDPPEHLQPGDVININGSPWALVRTGAGFAGSAHEFRPDRGAPPKSAPLLTRVHELAARNRLRKFNAGFRESMRCPEFELLSADDADYFLPLIFETTEQGKALLPLVEAIGRRSPRWKRWVKSLKKWCRTLDYQRQNAEWFFGIPTADEITSLGYGHD